MAASDDRLAAYFAGLIRRGCTVEEHTLERRSEVTRLGALTMDIAFEGIKLMLTAVLPLLGVCFALALVVGFGMTGGLFTTKALMPKLDKLNPAAGLQNIFFSGKTYVELVKNLLKLTVAGTTTASATNVTVNMSNAFLYADNTFARTNVARLIGTNTFTAIAKAQCLKNTQADSVNKA